MENSELVFTIFISLATSVVGGLLLHKYLQYKNNQIRKKIDEIDNDEKFITKLNKSQVKLQRTSFMTLLTAFAILCGCLAFLLGALALKLPENIMTYIYASCSWLLIVGGGICFKQAQSIVDSANLNEAKSRLSEKRQKLEQQLK